jgi:hypothetical protein
MEGKPARQMFLQSFSHVGFGSIWENLISASDDCANARGKPKRFSLAAYVHATMAPAPTHWNRRPASGTFETCRRTLKNVCLSG